MLDYDFDNIGQLVIRGEVIEHDVFAEMLEKYLDGFCATNCGANINAGEIICDECYRQAARYRVYGSPVDC